MYDVFQGLFIFFIAAVHNVPVIEFYYIFVLGCFLVGVEAVNFLLNNLINVLLRVAIVHEKSFYAGELCMDIIPRGRMAEGTVHHSSDDTLLVAVWTFRASIEAETQVCGFNVYLGGKAAALWLYGDIKERQFAIFFVFVGEVEDGLVPKG